VPAGPIKRTGVAAPNKQWVLAHWTRAALFTFEAECWCARSISHATRLATTPNARSRLGPQPMDRVKVQARTDSPEGEGPEKKMSPQLHDFLHDLPVVKPYRSLSHIPRSSVMRDKNNGSFPHCGGVQRMSIIWKPGLLVEIPGRFNRKAGIPGIVYQWPGNGGPAACWPTDNWVGPVASSSRHRCRPGLKARQPFPWCPVFVFEDQRGTPRCSYATEAGIR